MVLRTKTSEQDVEDQDQNEEQTATKPATRKQKNCGWLRAVGGSFRTLLRPSKETEQGVAPQAKMSGLIRHQGVPTKYRLEAERLQDPGGEGYGSNTTIGPSSPGPPELGGYAIEVLPFSHPEGVEKQKKLKKVTADPKKTRFSGFHKFAHSFWSKTTVFGTPPGPESEKNTIFWGPEMGPFWGGHFPGYAHGKMFVSGPRK